MKVINVKGTSNLTCPCNKWIEHWRNFSGQIANECRVEGCSEKKVVGAHVQKVYSDDKEMYIAPVCKEHNKSELPYELNKYTKLVLADPEKTCQKP